MRPILLALFSLSTLFLGSCDQTSTSQLETTSDRITEFSYVFEGQLELPADKDSYLLAHLVDVERDLRENASEQGDRIQELKSAMGSASKFEAHFLEQYKHGFPLFAENGEIEKAKLKYWIARQLKYNILILNHEKLSTTLKEVRKVQADLSADKKTISIKYQAVMSAVRHVTRTTSDLSQSPIDRAYSMKLPLNPVRYYFRAHTPQMKALLERGSFDFTAVRNMLDESKAIEGLAAASKTRCMVWDPAHLTSPFNEFYFFDSKLAECLTDGLTEIKVIEVQPLPRQTTYPEYHRLFADKRLSVFVYYGSVDNEEAASRAFANRLLANGYRKLSGPEEKNMRLEAKLGDIIIDLTLAVEKINPDARKDFQSALKTHEVVVYDGHAGFGANIDQQFTRYDAYPSHTYQIFVLNGCSTYKYGMTQVLDTKSLADFDFYNLNADVVTTYEAVSGHVQQEVLLSKLEGAARLFGRDQWAAADMSAFEKDYSWLPIVTAINSASDAINQGRNNGIFMVSGEEGNDYRPGAKDYTPSQTKTFDEMLVILKDPAQSEEIKARILRGFLGKKFVADAAGDIPVRLGETRDFCLDLKGYSDVGMLLQSDFYLPSCQVKSMAVASAQSFQSLSIGEGRVEFYENGSLKKAPVDAAFTAQGVAFLKPTETSVEFFPNGQPKKAMSSLPLTSHGIVFALGKPIDFYENGSVRRGEPQGGFVKDGMAYAAYLSTFSPEGKVLVARVAETTKLQNIRIPAGSYVERDETGRVLEIDSETADDDRTIEIPDYDLVIRNGSVRFYEDGGLRLIFTAEAEDDGPRGEAAYKGALYEHLAFYKNGQIASFGIMEAPENLAFPCRSFLEEAESFASFLFYPSGAFASCVLDEDYALQGKTIAAGEALVLREDGTLMENGERTAFSVLYEQLEIAKIFIYD